MPKVYGHNAQDAQRVARAVRKIERLPVDLTQPRRSGRGRGSGSSTPASTTKLVRVVDNLPGTGNNGDVYNPPTVRAFQMIPNAGGGWITDKSALVLIKPAAGIQVVLTDTDCCGSSAASAGNGLSVDYPQMTDQRIVDAEATAVTITGTTVDPTGDTITVTPIPAVTGAPFACTIAADGTWESANIDVTDLGLGPVAFKIERTDSDGFTHKPSYAILHYSKGESTTPPTTPNTAPDLTAASDDGASATDNTTTQTTPSFIVGSDVGADVTGPWPKLYDLRTLVAEGDSDTYGAGSEPQTAAIAVGTGVGGSPTLAEGTHYITFTNVTEYSSGNFTESGHSPLLELRVVTGEAEEEVVGRVYRQGIMQTIDGENVLTMLFDCPLPMNEAEIAVVDANTTITATANVADDYTTSDDPVDIEPGSVVITNPTADPDPAAPTSVALPDPDPEYDPGDPIDLAWNAGGSVWEIV